MPFGGYAAARINAELGGQDDAGGLINDYLEPCYDVRVKRRWSISSPQCFAEFLKRVDIAGSRITHCETEAR